MKSMLDRRDVLRLGLGVGALALLAGCDTTGFGLPSFGAIIPPATPKPRGTQSFGSGPVKVALLLPLSGDAAAAAIGASMANAAQLAMDYVAGAPRLGDNITLQLKDTGATAEAAASAAREAIAMGASLILGPLRAEQVEAAGAVARAAKIPLIGFSDHPDAAGPGVYLLNVLPQSEVHRSLTYALAHGHRSIAGVFPATDFGRVQRDAFETGIEQFGLTARSTFSFSNEADMRNVVEGVGPQIKLGRVDGLFYPDRATAAQFAGFLERAGVPKMALIIGSADWDNDPTILATRYLNGAVYPAVDPTGLKTLAPQYAARFGGPPNPLATIAYTAVTLANAGPLANAKPRYNAGVLTASAGFNGRDGVFRLLPNGQSQYALVMKQVTAGGAVVVDGPKI
jgi:ABC-type branched-subunit amino acid transport system substrate-binding protein